VLFRSEARYFLNVAKRVIVKRTLPPLPPKEQEPLTPTTDVQVQ
jgi:hypothetical protein